MVCRAELIEISMIAEISADNILGINMPVVDVFRTVNNFQIFGRVISESAVDLGKKIRQTEVTFRVVEKVPPRILVIRM